MKNIWKPLLFTVLLSGSACTANYLEINSNPYQPDKDQMQADGYLLGATMSGIMSGVISTDVNTAQFTDCLLGGTQGGYFADSNAEQRNTISNYNPTDNWTNVFMASDFVIPTLYSNLRELKEQTDDPVILAIADVIKVAAMHRVTDTYGPIPYSQIGADGQLQVPYDSQKAVYDKFFEELNAAIDVLTANRSVTIASSADNIYGGSAEKWCKFANSLKLRLAMRIVYADPATARTMAESAVSHEIGVMTSNDDNACMTSFGADGNPIYVAVNYNSATHSDNTACLTGGDSHAAADIICYMNAYNDPRRAAYFVESEWPGQTYVGMRRGIEIPDLSSIGHKYSGVKLTTSSPLYWMNAAEVAFLKAEAKAVFGSTWAAVRPRISTTRVSACRSSSGASRATRAILHRARRRRSSTSIPTTARTPIRIRFRRPRWPGRPVRPRRCRSASSSRSGSPTSILATRRGLISAVQAFRT